MPGASTAEEIKARGIDTYATMRGYNGLAVDALDRIPALLTGVEGTASSLPSAREGAVRAPEQAGIAALTRGGTWVAIGGRSRDKTDARYGSGILALQRRDGDTWRPQIPGRPLSGAGIATLAFQIRGQLYPMAGRLRSERSSKGVQITGGWGTPGGSIVDTGTTWRWSITPQGTVAVTFRVQRDRTLAVQALVGDGAKARDTAAGTIVDGRAGTRIEYALRSGSRLLTVRTSRRPCGGSAYDRAIRAVTLPHRGARGRADHAHRAPPPLTRPRRPPLAYPDHSATQRPCGARLPTIRACSGESVRQRPRRIGGPPRPAGRRCRPTWMPSLPTRMMWWHASDSPCTLPGSRSSSRRCPATSSGCCLASCVAPIWMRCRTASWLSVRSAS